MLTHPHLLVLRQSNLAKAYWLTLPDVGCATSWARVELLSSILCALSSLDLPSSVNKLSVLGRPHLLTVPDGLLIS